MKHRLLTVFASGLALTLSYRTHAQAVGRADSAAVAVAVAAASRSYVQAVQPEAVLYTGSEYANYLSPGTRGHQFFLTTEPLMGTVEYQGGFFKAVPLSYDLLRDQVVLYYPDRANAIRLAPDKLPAFTLGSQQFVRLSADSVAGTELLPGFYERLLAGPVSLLVRRTKQVVQTHVQQSLGLEIAQIDRVFGHSAHTTKEITSLKNLLALLPAHQDEVQRYARQRHLSFGAAQREASALEALRYYYTLPQ